MDSTISTILKNCKICKIDKYVSDFHPRHARCKSCYNDWQKQKRKNNPDTVRKYYENFKDSESYRKQIVRNRDHYHKNKESRLKKNKEWRNNNLDKISINKKEYYNKNKELILQKKKDHYLKNKSKIIEQKRQYGVKRRKVDHIFRLKNNLRRRLTSALKAKGLRKSSKTQRLVGCSVLELKAHLESLFKPGMTWENYGTWHVDHIIPISSFDLNDEAELLKACHYTNLQPLWAEENIRKSDDL